MEWEIGYETYIGGNMWSFHCMFSFNGNKEEAEVICNHIHPPKWKCSRSGMQFPYHRQAMRAVQ